MTELKTKFLKGQSVLVYLERVYVCGSECDQSDSVGGSNMQVIPLWYKGMTPDLWRKAELTLGETSSVKAKGVVQFRRLINEQQDIYSRLDEVFLLRFLRTKKFNVPKAFKLYLNYYAFISKQRGSFTGMKPSQVKHIIDMNNILYAPHRTPTGSHVAIYRMGHFNVNEGSAQELVSTILMISELILDCEATQISGGIIVIDMGGMTIQHYRQFVTVAFFSFMMNMLQDCIPERLQDIHFVNEPFLAHAVFNIIKPIVRKKMKERLHFHGSNLNSLHVYVPKDCLPEELGGHLGHFDNKEFAEYFFSQEAFFERINKYGIIEQEMPRK